VRPNVAKALIDFINTWPLYSPFSVKFEPPLPGPPNLPLTILRDCRVCQATPTWSEKNPISQGWSSAIISPGMGSILAYECMHCERQQLWIWFAREDERGTAANGQAVVNGSVFRKLGQWPAPTSEPDREVANALTEPLLELFKKGLTSVAHGYGLGALAYFRRLVEDGSSLLIDLFAKRAEAEGDTEVAAQIRAAGLAPHMEDRLKVAAAALPPTLRPGGVNPLSVLYHHYSRGIHGLSDDECLVVAQHLQSSLEYIFSNWRRQMEDAADFRRTVEKWSNPAKSAKQSEAE